MLQLQMLQFVQFYVEIDFQDIVIKIFLEAFIYFDEDSASGLTKFFFSFFNAFSAQLRKWNISFQERLVLSIHKTIGNLNSVTGLYIWLTLKYTYTNTYVYQLIAFMNSAYILILFIREAMNCLLVSNKFLRILI